MANAKLMSDFVQSLNGVTGGLVVEKVVQAEEEIEQYPELTFSQQGIDLSYVPAPFTRSIKSAIAVLEMVSGVISSCFSVAIPVNKFDCS